MLFQATATVEKPGDDEARKKAAEEAAKAAQSTAQIANRPPPAVPHPKIPQMSQKEVEDSHHEVRETRGEHQEGVSVNTEVNVDEKKYTGSPISEGTEGFSGEFTSDTDITRLVNTGEIDPSLKMLGAEFNFIPQPEFVLAVQDNVKVAPEKLKKDKYWQEQQQSEYKDPQLQEQYKAQAATLFSNMVESDPQKIGGLGFGAFLAMYTAYSHGVENGQINKGEFVATDLTQPSNMNRTYVFDFEKGSVIAAIKGAHGMGNGIESQDSKKLSRQWAYRTSNEGASTDGSNCTPQGLFALKPQQHEKYGRIYVLEGLEPQVNDESEKRKIYIHRATYVPKNQSDGYCGTSNGCLAVNESDANKAGLLIGNGRENEKPIGAKTGYFVYHDEQEVKKRISDGVLAYGAYDKFELKPRDGEKLPRPEIVVAKNERGDEQKTQVPKNLQESQIIQNVLQKYPDAKINTQNGLHTITIAMNIGETKQNLEIYVKEGYTPKEGEVFFAHIHESEKISNEAMKGVIRQDGGVGISFEDDGQRNRIASVGGNEVVSFDPNRMFSEEGVKKMTKRASVQNAILDFANEYTELIEKFNPIGIVTAHNMRHGNYKTSFKTEEKIHGEENNQTFYYTTNRDTADFVSKVQIGNGLTQPNVVHPKEGEEDNGSGLSRWANDRGIPYINNETPNLEATERRIEDQKTRLIIARSTIEQMNKPQILASKEEAKSQITPKKPAKEIIVEPQIIAARTKTPVEKKKQPQEVVIEPEVIVAQMKSGAESQEKKVEERMVNEGQTQNIFSGKFTLKGGDNVWNNLVNEAVAATGVDRKDRGAMRRINSAVANLIADGEIEVNGKKKWNANRLKTGSTVVYDPQALQKELEKKGFEFEAPKKINSKEEGLEQPQIQTQEEQSPIITPSSIESEKIEFEKRGATFSYEVGTGVTSYIQAAAFMPNSIWREIMPTKDVDVLQGAAGGMTAPAGMNELARNNIRNMSFLGLSGNIAPNFLNGLGNMWAPLEVDTPFYLKGVSSGELSDEQAQSVAAKAMTGGSFDELSKNQQSMLTSLAKVKAMQKYGAPTDKYLEECANFYVSMFEELKSQNPDVFEDMKQWAVMSGEMIADGIGKEYSGITVGVQNLVAEGNEINVGVGLNPKIVGDVELENVAVFSLKMQQKLAQVQTGNLTINVNAKAYVNFVYAMEGAKASSPFYYSACQKFTNVSELGSGGGVQPDLLLNVDATYRPINDLEIGANVRMSTLSPIYGQKMGEFLVNSMQTKLDVNGTGYGEVANRVMERTGGVGTYTPTTMYGLNTKYNFSTTGAAFEVEGRVGGRVYPFTVNEASVGMTVQFATNTVMDNIKLNLQAGVNTLGGSVINSGNANPFVKFGVNVNLGGGKTKYKVHMETEAQAFAGYGAPFEKYGAAMVNPSIGASVKHEFDEQTKTVTFEAPPITGEPPITAEKQITIKELNAAREQLAELVNEDEGLKHIEEAMDANKLSGELQQAGKIEQAYYVIEFTIKKIENKIRGAEVK